MIARILITLAELYLSLTPNGQLYPEQLIVSEIATVSGAPNHLRASERISRRHTLELGATSAHHLQSRRPRHNLFMRAADEINCD